MKPERFLSSLGMTAVTHKRNKTGVQSDHTSMDKIFHVYIVASASGVLYVGVTSNLLRRIYEHKEQKIDGFTKRYNVTKLVWFEIHGTAKSAISREKQIKSWRRSKKVALIDANNRKWIDLTATLTSAPPPIS